jgi:hypothetical protein
MGFCDVEKKDQESVKKCLGENEIKEVSCKVASGAGKLVLGWVGVMGVLVAVMGPGNF